ncbi:glycoside hydrolase family 2 TIM barrel-domain containing protein [Thermodesulfobacteriota bacterium]
MMKKPFLAVVLVGLSILASACLEIATEPFYAGWYSGVYHNDPSEEIVAIGGSRALYYHMGYLTDEKVQSRLDEAYANGLEIIMNVDGIDQDGSDVIAVDAARVQEFVATFKDHPGVIGWYTADEPSGLAQKALCQVAYDAVKAVDPDKPVYLCINHSDNGSIVLFAPAYDVLIYDSYKFKQGDPACYRIESHGFLWWHDNGLKEQFADVALRAAVAGRPWVFAAQGFGRAIDCDTRLPTVREHRFQTYYAFLKGAQGILAFEYNAALDSVADPEDAYPEAGTQWVTDVYQPLAEEIALIGDALGTEPDTTNVSDDATDLHSNLYQDPNNGNYYLFALNDSDNDFNTTFTIILTGDWIEAVPLNGSSAIQLSDNQFTDYFDRYDVIVYELVPGS